MLPFCKSIAKAYDASEETSSTQSSHSDVRGYDDTFLTSLRSRRRPKYHPAHGRRMQHLPTLDARAIFRLAVGLAVAGFLIFLLLRKDAQTRWNEAFTSHLKHSLSPQERTTAFANVHLFMRMIKFRPDRIAIASLYAPYFQATTISMPHLRPTSMNGIPLFDDHPDPETFYGPVGQYLVDIKHSGVEGMLHNHFDVRSYFFAAKTH